MRKYLLLAFIIMGPVSLAFITQDITYAVDSKDSSMVITGTSNLHDWEADVNTIYGKVIVKRAFLRGNTSGNSIKDAFIRITVEDIRSDNNQLTKKLHKALDTENHRFITFQLKKAGVDEEEGMLKIEASGDLTVSGTTKSIQLENVKAGFSDDRSTLRFSGSKKLNMKNFGVDPPTALLGSLKTDEEVTVTFELVATKQDEDD